MAVGLMQTALVVVARAGAGAPLTRLWHRNGEDGEPRRSIVTEPSERKCSENSGNNLGSYPEELTDDQIAYVHEIAERRREVWRKHSERRRLLPKDGI